ncbi:MAG: hypothetical protein HC803_04225 [Saprospiraceae bacterium]|nr:hypothetical protein [Saprospiraceae bacterium]
MEQMQHRPVAAKAATVVVAGRWIRQNVVVKKSFSNQFNLFSTMKNSIQHIFKITIFLSSLMFIGCQADQGSPEVISETGVGGSLARFTVVGNYLYVIDDTSLKMYNVNQADNPTFIKSVDVGRGIETIYPFAGKLFIGSQNGLYIYNINTDGTPEFISEYIHITSCDPVATDGQYAYVTLRAATECNFWGGVNLLDILDVTDVENPVHIASYPMESPLGVGIANKTLFVCEVDFGLKIFDVTNPQDMQLIEHFTEIKARDVIVLDGTVLVLTADTIYQLDYSDLNNITIISSMAIEV